MPENQVPQSVLVVDDDLGWQSLIRDAIEEEGLRVVLAASLEQARESLETEQISLVILDVLFGTQEVVPSGIGFGRQMKNSPRWKEMPLVFCTVVATTKLLHEMEELVGKDRILQKPPNFRELVRLVRGIVDEKRA